MRTEERLSHFLGDSFVTYRRWWLETLLEEHSTRFQGDVIDLGGENQTMRGSWKRPETTSWKCVNIDKAARPDILASVDSVPLQDGCADVVLCTEVLEHLAEPGKCVAEARRLLKPGGTLLASTPFIYPVHGDPDDYFRYTPSALRNLFSEFSDVEIRAMGSSAGTVGLIGEKALQPWMRGNIIQRAIRRLLILGLRSLCYLDSRRSPKAGSLPELTTGYFVTARKS